MEGTREGRGGKERENIEEGWEGVIVSHVEHAQHICFKWHRHKFVPLKKAKMSSTHGSLHIIWPGIIQRFERETGYKLKGSLWPIAGLLLINTFFYPQSRLRCWLSTRVKSGEDKRVLNQPSRIHVFSDDCW